MSDRPTAGRPPDPHPALRTRICELFGVRYPIVQTGMGWVSGPRLTAATANAGGLGLLGSSTMTYEQLVAAIDEVQSRTSAPFGVNLRADAVDAERRVRLLIARGVKVASFALAPKQDLIRILKDAGVAVVPSIGARRHAEKVAAWGVDAVVVQGAEGGGHTGKVPTSLLVPQVVDAVDIPVIAAGGYFDGRGLVSALAYGADGIAMGTRFLLTRDNAVPETIKTHYLQSSVDDTVVTTEVDGVPQRLLRTPLVDDLLSARATTRLVRAVRSAATFRRLSGTSWSHFVREGLSMRRSHELSWSQVVMAANTPMLLRSAMVEGRTDLGLLATGQVVGLIDDLPSCEELIARIVTEANEVLDRLGRAEPG